MSPDSDGAAASLDEAIERWAGTADIPEPEKQRVKDWVRDFVTRNDVRYDNEQDRSAASDTPGGPDTTPLITRDELLARWASADQAPLEERQRAKEWARRLIETLRDEVDPPRPA